MLTLSTGWSKRWKTSKNGKPRTSRSCYLCKSVHTLCVGQALICSSLQGHSIEVHVSSGSDRAIWNIPKALLQHHSDYFRLTCSKGYLARTHTLSDCAPRLFQHFVQWMYFGTIPTLEDEYHCDELRLWALGSKLVAKEFKDFVMRKIYELYSFAGGDPVHFSVKEAEWCWNNTAPESCLRKLFLDLLPQHWIYLEYFGDGKEDWSEFFARHPDLSHTLLLAVAGACADRKGKPEVMPVTGYLESSKVEK